MLTKQAALFVFRSECCATLNSGDAASLPIPAYMDWETTMEEITSGWGSRAWNRTQSLAVVIMAAGKGTRLKSRRPKVLHEVGGKPLLAHVIAANQVVVPADIYVIIGHEAEQVRTTVAATGVRFTEQTEQLALAMPFSAPPKPLPGTSTFWCSLAMCLSSHIFIDSFAVSSGRACRYDDTHRRSRRSHRLWAHRAQIFFRIHQRLQPSSSRRRLRRSSRPFARSTLAFTLLRPRLCWLTSGKLTADNANREVVLTDMAGLLSAQWGARGCHSGREDSRGPRRQYHCRTGRSRLHPALSRPAASWLPE